MVHFTKMHGAGNDYIYVNGFREMVPDPQGFARFISDRHFGAGSDGLVLILPSDVADFRMRMFNADGSEGRMCGNASRCVGKYVYDYGLTQKTTVTLETLAGIKTLHLHLGGDGRVDWVRAELGAPSLAPGDIPVRTALAAFVEQPVEVDGHLYPTTCVSMGSPHAVTFVEDPRSLDLARLGPLFEHHPLFPEGLNIEFVRVLGPLLLELRVWERGSGETLACGTGACAAVVTAALLGKCPYDQDVTVRLLGGELIIRCPREGSVLMTGPAATIFDGQTEYSFG